MRYECVSAGDDDDDKDADDDPWVVSSAAAAAADVLPYPVAAQEKTGESQRKSRDARA